MLVSSYGWTDEQNFSCLQSLVGQCCSFGSEFGAVLDQSWWFLPGDGSARLGLVDRTTAVTCFGSPPRPALSAECRAVSAKAGKAESGPSGFSPHCMVHPRWFQNCSVYYILMQKWVERQFEGNYCYLLVTLGFLTCLQIAHSLCSTGRGGFDVQTKSKPQTMQIFH